MIVTLYLISANVYNSVSAPPSRGFSYIEIWMLGTQSPILIAILEYGFVLYLKKKATNPNKTRPLKGIKTAFGPSNVAVENRLTDIEVEAKIRKIDDATFIISFFSLLLFIICFFFFSLVI